MSIRFAAAHHSMAARFVRPRSALLLPHAANDNRRAGAASPALDDALCDALRHFAEHGLGAAEQARQEAERCHAQGALDACREWLEICRRLDRRMASTLARKLDLTPPGA